MVDVELEGVRGVGYRAPGSAASIFVEGVVGISVEEGGGVISRGGDFDFLILFGTFALASLRGLIGVGSFGSDVYHLRRFCESQLKVSKIVHRR